VPQGPDKLEFVNWVFAEKDASPELRDKMLKQTIQLFGTSGMVEQDDSDTWPHMTLAAKGAMGRKSTMKYQQSLKRGRRKAGLARASSTKVSPRTIPSGTGGCTGMS